MASQRGPYPGHGNQPLYSSGIAQRMGSHARNGDASAAPQTNGHLAVPMANVPRSYSQQQAIQGGLPNGGQTSNRLARMGMAGRSQPSMHGQDRAGPQYHATGQMNEQNIQQLMQQAQQQSRTNAQYPVQRPMSQNQFNRGSSNLAHTNGASNMNVLGHFNQANAPNGDTAGSPRPTTGTMHGSGHGSPDMANLAPQNQGSGHASQPQSLSTGQVPTVIGLQHQLMQQHPGMALEEIQRLTTHELKMRVEDPSRGNSYDRSRQNAINAATGMHSNLQQQQQQQSLRQAGPQSPYVQQQRSSPYMQNDMLPSSTIHSQPHQQGQTQTQSQSQAQPQHQQQQQASATSPVNAMAVQHNKNYAQQMRQSTNQMMRRSGLDPSSSNNVSTANANANGNANVNGNATTMASPSLNSANVNVHAMRPPSSMGGAGGMSISTGDTAQQ